MSQPKDTPIDTEADFCLAKRLGMDPRTRGMRLSAGRPLLPWQDLHVSAPHRQLGGHSGDRFGLPRKEQARQDSKPGDTARRLKHVCHPSLYHAAFGTNTDKSHLFRLSPVFLSGSEGKYKLTYRDQSWK